MIPGHVFVLTPIIFGVLLFLLNSTYAKQSVLAFQLGLVFASFYNFVKLRLLEIPLSIECFGGWSRVIGIALKWDLVSAVFVILTTILFFFLFVFDYRSGHANRLFLMLFCTLQGLIIGIFLTHDFFNVFVLYEVSTIIVSILIMFQKDKQSIYDGMLYLLTNLTAMVFFLFGVAILYRMLGVLDFALAKDQMALLSSTRSLILPYAFFLTALSLKTAILPLFSWLPRAHATPSAPSTVSALLSGLFVKNSLYLFFRIRNVFDPFLEITEFFLFLGWLTAFFGALLALSQKDIKLILAYSTVSQLGLITMGLNMDHELAFWGAVYHILNHAVFKSTLFLSAGIITETYGTRDIEKIRGVGRRMPLVAAATILAILGITGAPFFSGSMSKYWIAYGAKDALTTLAFFVANLGTITCFIRYSAILFGPQIHPMPSSPSLPTMQHSTVLVMGFLSLFGGLFARELTIFFFGKQLPLDPLSYLQKGGIFLASLLGGFLVVRTIGQSKVLERIRTLDLSFNDVGMLMFLFFSLSFLYLTVKYAFL
ncbi:MAG: proton-conducting transporter membrane subunit [Atribacterota bacterium]